MCVAARGGMIRRLATACSILGWIVLASGESGCGGGNCLANCVDGRITFHLASLIQSPHFHIAVTSPSAALTSDCWSSDEGLSCSGSSQLVANGSFLGSLQSVEVPFMGAGPYRIQITPDNAPVVDEAFQYGSAPVEGACGSSCHPSATFEIQN